MNSSIHRFTLNMHSAQSQISIPVMLGDTGRTLRISLSDGSNQYFIADGCLAKISIKRPTETRLEDFCTIEDNTTIVYPFGENTCAVEGIHDCDITLYGLDGKVITSPRFTMVVNERVVRSDDIVITDADQTAVDAMLVKEAERQVAEAERVAAEQARITAGEVALKAVADAQEAARNATEDAREEVTRLVGEMGIVQTTGDSETAVMSQKAATEEINHITAKLKFNSSPNIYRAEMYVSGYISISGGINESSYYRYSPEYIPVKAGDILRAYRINDGVLQLRIFGFVTAYDANKQVLQPLGVRDVTTYTVPAGVAFVRLTLDSQHCEVTINHEATEYTPYTEPHYVATDEFIPQLGDIATILDSIVEVE